MLKEIAEGEKQLLEVESDVRSLRMSLGLDTLGDSPANDLPVPKPTERSNQRVGQRKPKRDPVGL